jgi:hypothetical protein
MELLVSPVAQSGQAPPELALAAMVFGPGAQNELHLHDLTTEKRVGKTPPKASPTALGI